MARNKKSKKTVKNTKHKMSLVESIELDFIDSINIEEECFNIVENPQKYFEKSLNASKKPFYIICAKFSIISKIREIDSNTSISDNVSLYFMEKYSIKKWLGILSNLYTYYFSLMTYILDNYENTLLDLYNDNEITMDIMKMGMTTFQETKVIINKDAELIKKCISDIENEKIKFENIG